jgi:dipeptidase
MNALGLSLATFSGVFATTFASFALIDGPAVPSEAWWTSGSLAVTTIGTVAMMLKNQRDQEKAAAERAEHEAQTLSDREDKNNAHQERLAEIRGKNLEAVAKINADAVSGLVSTFTTQQKALIEEQHAHSRANMQQVVLGSQEIQRDIHAALVKQTELMQRILERRPA